MDISYKTGVLQKVFVICRKTNSRREGKVLFVEYYNAFKSRKLI